MRELVELIGHELKWIQPHALKMEYELRAGDTVAATLQIRSAFRSFATATSADGVWTFNRAGFFQSKAMIRSEASETDLAVFNNNTWNGGGTLELAYGRKYPAKTNFWSTQYEFKTESGENLISYRKIDGFLHMSSITTIHPLARNIPEMPWMVLLGWYLIVMLHMDYSLTAAFVAST